jgi:hypothetical protein
MPITRRILSLSCATVLTAGTAILIIPTTARAAAPCDEPSLVTAITTVNGAGGGTVTLTPGCTYALTTNHSTGHGANGLPLITTAITLEGNANTITRSAGAPAFRIVEVTGTVESKRAAHGRPFSRGRAGMLLGGLVLDRGRGGKDPCPLSNLSGERAGDRGSLP